MLSEYQVECVIIDAIEKLESTTQWVGPRPAGYLEQEAQKALAEQ